jgi:hypothetical protein
MSEPEILPPASDTAKEELQPRGPSLKLLYALAALALAVAIGLALLIVAPFYRRR